MNPLKQLSELEKNITPMRLAAESWDEPWKILISTILSARTRDEVTIPVSEKLFLDYNLQSLAKAPLSSIEKIIKPINFYKNKSKNIKNCAKVLVKEHNCKIPINFDKLIQLPGVGRKTANVFLSELGKDTIAVDTHVNFISNKLNWTKNKDLKKIEEDLKKLFPKKYWKKLNPILVRFGKTYTSRKKKNELLEKIKR